MKIYKFYVIYDFTFHLLGFQAVVVSGFVTQNDGLENCEMFYGDSHSVKPKLKFEIEKADARLIPQVKNAVLGGSTKIVV